MFVVNEDNSIYATRGDIVFFGVTAEDNGAPYVFQAGDVVRIKVYGKKNAENVVLQKDFPVNKAAEEVEIYLTEEDTKFGDVISKPTDYWYEVELNPYDHPQTIIGYDEDGAKVFKLYPEGDDIPAFVPEAEDIPVVDDALDMTSTRPVQNQAVARAVVRIGNQVDNACEMVESNKREIAAERARINNLAQLKEGSTTGDAELVDGRFDGLTVYGNIGNAIRAKTDADFEVLNATKLAQPVIPIMGRVEIGFVQITEDGLTYKEYANYARTKEGVTIHLDAGDTIVCANETRVYTGYLSGGKYIGSGWTSNFVAGVAADYVLLFSNYPISDIEDLDAFMGNITIKRAENYSAKIEVLEKNAAHLLSLENTYQSKCELAVGDATTTNAMRYCAKLASPAYGVKITMPGTIKYGIQGYSNSAYTTKVYDSGWKTEQGWVVFDNPALHYVVLFIRNDSTVPTSADRANTTVFQSLDLTQILDETRGHFSKTTLAHYDSTNDIIRSVAHRGLSASAPENTAPAFILAKQAGFSYVETDIQVTKDGKYVCVHDETISKYTSGAYTGAVVDYTLAELKAIDFGAWKDEKWAGTKILTFEEFILLCKKLGLKAYLELKQTHSEADIAYYLDHVRKMGMMDNCVWRGATYNTNIRALSDAAVLAYDASSIMTEEKVRQLAERYSPMFFHNNYSYVTESVVALCHKYGVRIEAYTINDEATLDELAAMGVDGITTDSLLAGKVFFENMM